MPIRTPALVWIALVLAALPTLSGRDLVFSKVDAKLELGNPLCGYYRWRSTESVPVATPSQDSYERFTWSDLELDTPASYDLSPIRKAIAKAKQSGGPHAKLGLRIRCMKGADDKGTFVPAYLRKAMALGWEKKGTYIPDWNDPQLILRYRALLDKVASEFDGHRDISYIDIGTYGLWGEWHAGRLGYPAPSGALDATPETLKRYVEDYVAAFKKTRLLMMSDNEVALIHALSLSPAIGWRRDSFGDPHFSRGLTPAKRAVLEDRWKNAPVVVEFISKTRLQTALLSEQVGTWHVAAISNGNFGPWEERSALERDQLQQAGLLAGHRIGFSRLILPDTLVAGSSFDFVSHWYNDGVTPVYEPYVAQLCLSRGEKELWRAPLSMRPSALLPTKGSALAFTDKLTLPATLPPGEYMLAIRVDSEDGSRGPLTLAVATQRDSRLGYELGSVQVLAAAKAP